MTHKEQITYLFTQISKVFSQIIWQNFVKYPRDCRCFTHLKSFPTWWAARTSDTTKQLFLFIASAPSAFCNTCFTYWDFAKTYTGAPPALGEGWYCPTEAGCTLACYLEQEMSKEAKKHEEREEVLKTSVQSYLINCWFTHFANKEGLLYLESKQTGTVDVF